MFTANGHYLIFHVYNSTWTTTTTKPPPPPQKKTHLIQNVLLTNINTLITNEHVTTPWFTYTLLISNEPVCSCTTFPQHIRLSSLSFEEFPPVLSGTKMMSPKQSWLGRLSPPPSPGHLHHAKTKYVDTVIQDHLFHHKDSRSMQCLNPFCAPCAYKLLFILEMSY